MAQLVGSNCARCGERITNELDSRFCATCNSPVHDRCAHPSAVGIGCPVCGALSYTPESPADPAPVVFYPPKNSTLAFTLSLFLPGAGLWYLGLWRWGLVNLLAVFGIGVVAALTLSDAEFDRNSRLIGGMCGAGSGGLAMALTNQRNLRNQPAKRI